MLGVVLPSGSPGRGLFPFAPKPRGVLRPHPSWLFPALDYALEGQAKVKLDTSGSLGWLSPARHFPEL